MRYITGAQLRYSIFGMNNKLPTNVFVLLESFQVIAETLNISQAAKAMKVSRITLSKRLKDLEELCGYTLLEFESHNRYKLTARAENWIQEVRVWLRQGEDLFALSNERATGLLQSSSQKPGERFHSQQHSLSSLWEHNSPYLNSMLTAWMQAEGQTNSDAFAEVRQNAILARLHHDEFIIMEIGENAAMMKWLGSKFCLSAIGKPLSSTAMSSKADQTITYTYRQAILQGSPWYDHVSADLPRPEIGTAEQAFYRRLVLPCKLPDGSPVIASIVELSDELVIGDLEVPRVNQPTGGS